MFKIKGNNFHVTRGDTGSFNVKFTDYTFNVGDIIELNVYNEYNMNAEPIMTKQVEIDTASAVANITLLGEDTLIGPPITERETYWYEITLNGDQTPFCYDENGPKYFYLYPGGVN